jgi:hypothetical protein
MTIEITLLIAGGVLVSTLIWISHRIRLMSRQLSEIQGEVDALRDVVFRVFLMQFNRKNEPSDVTPPPPSDGEPDQAAQGAALLRSHVVPQRNRQSGAARSPHCRIPADARRACRGSSDKPARHRRVCDDPRTPDQDRCACDRAHRAHSRPPANQLPGTGIVPNRAPGLLRSGP